jgi:hypothetical protein
LPLSRCQQAGLLKTACLHGTRRAKRCWSSGIEGHHRWCTPHQLLLLLLLLLPLPAPVVTRVQGLCGCCRQLLLLLLLLLLL